MNLLQALALALLACSLVVGGAHGRTIAASDDDAFENAIEVASEEEQQQREKQRAVFDKEWIKFSKAPPATLQQTVGVPLKIICEVIGSQVPNVNWVEGYPSASEARDSSNVITESSPTAIVKVQAVRVVDHVLIKPVTYTCVGRTGSEMVYASTTVYPHGRADLQDLVKVREPSFPVPHKPVIIYSEKMHLDLVGSSLQLPCKVHAWPHAVISWINEDGNVLGGGRFNVMASGDLIISNIKWEDMGVYKCIARNHVGKDTAETFIYPVLKEDK